MVRTMQILYHDPVAPNFETIGITEEDGIKRYYTTLQFFGHWKCDFGMLWLGGSFGKGVKNHNYQQKS